MDVDAEAVSFIVLPLAFVDVAIGVPELAGAVGLILSPLTLILGSIGPNLNTGSMSHSIFEVA